jgi:glycosyltransferase involved in cell wall biosynthesis
MVQSASPRVAIDAHVVGRRQTGNETYVVELAGALARRDDVEPIAYVDSGTRWPRPGAPLLRELRWTSRLLRIPLELPVRARQDRARILQVQYVAPPVAGIPLAVVVHDVSYLDLPDGFPRLTSLRMRATISASVRKANLVITGSDFTAERLMDAYRLGPDRVVVTPYGVDPRWRPLPAAESAQIIAEAGVRLPQRFVLAIGNVHPRKNIPRLIRAVAALRSDGFGDVELVLVGQHQWGGTDVARAIDDVGGDGWIHPTGYVEHRTLVAMTGRASVVAYPSLYEGFGLPVLEALACGAPVVCSDRTSMREVAGDAAILVAPESVDAIADGLRIALADPAVREVASLRGPAHAAAYTWDRCAEATVAAYRRILG